MSLSLFRAAPKDEDEMMVAIFEYIDRIFNIVRPRRLLYMAIDGVVRVCVCMCVCVYTDVFSVSLCNACYQSGTHNLRGSN